MRIRVKKKLNKIFFSSLTQNFVILYTLLLNQLLTATATTIGRFASDSIFNSSELFRSF